MKYSFKISSGGFRTLIFPGGSTAAASTEALCFMKLVSIDHIDSEINTETTLTVIQVFNFYFNNLFSVSYFSRFPNIPPRYLSPPPFLFLALSLFKKEAEKSFLYQWWFRNERVKFILRKRHKFIKH